MIGRRQRISPDALGALSVLTGGAAGALARAGVAEALPHRAGTWPWATFAVNVAGAALLAWLTTRLTGLDERSRYWRLAAGTGFCGAFTTFSTFQVETIRLARDGHGGLALLYAAASLSAGMAAVVVVTLRVRRSRPA